MVVQIRINDCKHDYDRQIHLKILHFPTFVIKKKFSPPPEENLSLDLNPGLLREEQLLYLCSTAGYLQICLCIRRELQ